MNKRGICYDPLNMGIVIPHYDIDNNLIGIRERTLIKEEEVFGKYKPEKKLGEGSWVDNNIITPLALLYII